MQPRRVGEAPERPRRRPEDVKQHGRVYLIDPPVSLVRCVQKIRPWAGNPAPAPQILCRRPYPAVTAIFRGVALATLGRLTVRTPSASLASILAWSMTSDSVNWRK